LKILILDNYDSFTYNLAHLVEKISDAPLDVYKNDEIRMEDIAQYQKIILSPGPGLPKDGGIMPELLKTYHASKSIFGVCLGMQAIGELFGARLKNLSSVYHGLALPVTVTRDPLFRDCPSTFMVGRYHSWVVDKEQLPVDLRIIAEDQNGHIMALRHKHDDVSGVQFHPESILSEYGETILRNWITN
jgi:anthranilate synthase component 2